MDDLDLGRTLRGFAAGQKVFGRYTLARLLGRGGMGVVWLARDEELEQEVALKFLPEVVMGDNGAVDDMRRETRRARELTHPNIVRIHDFLRDSRMAAISMEYVAGDSLANRRLELPARVFEPAELAKWVEQLCGALEYAHTMAKIVHRDLKPANLMVDARGDLKIADFGISATLSDTTTRVSKQAGSSGTPVYMSPQQMMGEKPAATDDIYSLGATLYELLTGKPPFYTGNVLLQVQNKVPPSITERRGELGVGERSAEAGDRSQEPIPQAWEETIAACLAKDPAQRPQRASEVWQRLSGKLFTREAHVVPSVISPVREEPISVAVAEPDKPRLRLPLWSIAAGLVMVFAGGWYFGIRMPEQKRQVEIARVEAQRLAAARGNVVIRTDPAGAEVQVGAIALERSPLSAIGLKLGKYPVRIRLAGYDEWVGEVEVREGVSTELPVRLVRSVGTLEVGTARAKTPWSLVSVPDGVQLPKKSGEGFVSFGPVPTGVYVFEFHDEAGVYTTESIEVKAGTKAALEHAIRSGVLSLSSNLESVTWQIAETPANARMVTKEGTLPFVLETVPVGNYAVRFTRAGWPDLREVVHVDEGKETKLTGTFPAGTVQIDSTPSGAEVWSTEGKLLGLTPLTLADEHAGAESWVLKKDGFAAYPLAGVVKIGEVLKLKVTMQEHPAIALYAKIKALCDNEEFDKTLAPCNELLSMPDAPLKEKAAAYVMRGLGKRIKAEHDAAIRDFSEVIDDEKFPLAWRAESYNQRGIAKLAMKDNDGAVKDYSAAVALSTKLLDDSFMAPEVKVLALKTRGSANIGLGNNADCIADYSSIIEMPGARPVDVASALVNRGVMEGREGDFVGEIADCTRVLGMSDIPLNLRLLALGNRAFAKSKMDDVRGAIADYTEIIGLGSSMDKEKLAAAYIERGVKREILGEYAGEIADFSEALMLSVVSERRALALSNRAIARWKSKDIPGSITDWTEIITMRGSITNDKLASAFINRGVRRQDLGDNSGQIADDTAALSLSGVTINIRALALQNRARSRFSLKNNSGAIADYTELIALGGEVASKMMAQAYSERASLKLSMQDYLGTIADCDAAVRIGAAGGANVLSAAYCRRGVAREQTGDKAGAQSDYLSSVNVEGADESVKQYARGNLKRR